VIEDIDAVIEREPGWRERWALPAACALALATVLGVTFARLPAAPRTVFAVPPPPVSLLAHLPPATGVKAIELPRDRATLETRLQFSGTTGLTSMQMSDGFRDTYTLPDGRRVIVIEYPDPASALLAPAQRSAVRVRGVTGALFDTGSASQPQAIAWVADGMQYQVGGAFTADELISLAEQLR